MGILLFFYIATHGGFHVCHTLLYNGLFYHVDPRSTEGVTRLGSVGIASLMKNVPGTALGTVFYRGIGGLGGLIEGFNVYDFEAAEGIFKALNGLGEAVPGDGISGFAVLKFLL
jgi:hypothetical protein